MCNKSLKNFMRKAAELRGSYRVTVSGDNGSNQRWPGPSIVRENCTIAHCSQYFEISRFFLSDSLPVLQKLPTKMAVTGFLFVFFSPLMRTTNVMRSKTS